jgi:hypothetical protein
MARAACVPSSRDCVQCAGFAEAEVAIRVADDQVIDSPMSSTSGLDQRPWYPVGNGNMMNILDNGIRPAHTMSFEQLDRGLDLITYNGAKT